MNGKKGRPGDLRPGAGEGSSVAVQGGIHGVMLCVASSREDPQVTCVRTSQKHKL